jgi:hypothetical protein
MVEWHTGPSVVVVLPTHRGQVQGFTFVSARLARGIDPEMPGDGSDEERLSRCSTV